MENRCCFTYCHVLHLFISCMLSCLSSRGKSWCERLAVALEGRVTEFLPRRETATGSLIPLGGMLIRLGGMLIPLGGMLIPLGGMLGSVHRASCDARPLSMQGRRWQKSPPRGREPASCLAAKTKRTAVEIMHYYITV